MHRTFHYNHLPGPPHTYNVPEGQKPYVEAKIGQIGCSLISKMQPFCTSIENITQVCPALIHVYKVLFTLLASFWNDLITVCHNVYHMCLFSV